MKNGFCGVCFFVTCLNALRASLALVKLNQSTANKYLTSSGCHTTRCAGKENDRCRTLATLSRTCAEPSSDDALYRAPLRNVRYKTKTGTERSVCEQTKRAARTGVDRRENVALKQRFELRRHLLRNQRTTSHQRSVVRTTSKRAKHVQRRCDSCRRRSSPAQRTVATQCSARLSIVEHRTTTYLAVPNTAQKGTLIFYR